MSSAYNGGSTRPLTRQLVLRDGVNVETLAAAKTLDDHSSNIQILDPGGASRDVTLPAENGRANGLPFWFYNSADAAENLVIKNDAGTTITTIGMGKGAMVACDGSAWKVVSPPEADSSLAALLASTANGEGASIVGVEDAGGFTAQTDVEGHLQEIDPGAWFKSTEQTGTGAILDVPHGLGRAPRLVLVLVSDNNGGAAIWSEGATDATNVKIDMTTGAKFYVVAV
jgi:hypothetical protein